MLMSASMSKESSGLQDSLLPEAVGKLKSLQAQFAAAKQELNEAKQLAKR
jgi:hypothetical protein